MKAVGATISALRVAIDCEHVRQTGAGVTRYSASLINALRQRGDTEVIALGGGDLVARGTLRKRMVTARQELLWYPWMGRRHARAAGADVYHCPTLRAPLTKGKPPLVVTIHDLVPMLFPETMSTWSRLYTRATLRSVVRSADIIVAVSQTTANDLNRLLHVSPDRIRVVWSGVDEIFLNKAGTRSPPVVPPYVLFVGTPEPRKNLPRLVEAMNLLRMHGLEERLVIAGGGGWGKVALDSREVHLLGRVTDAELLSLYTHASCVALPSLYEGFGLTAVEAMAVGTPVVASSAGSLPEIAGSAAVLVDPYDVGAIAAGLERAICERDSLSVLGQERAKQFRWDRTAAMMTKVYREVA